MLFEFDLFAGLAVFFADPALLARSASRFNPACPRKYGEGAPVPGANLLTATGLASGVREALDPAPNHTHRSLVVNPVTGAAMKKKNYGCRNEYYSIRVLDYTQTQTHKHTQTHTKDERRTARTSRSRHTSYSRNTHVLVVMSPVALSRFHTR